MHVPCIWLQAKRRMGPIVHYLAIDALKRRRELAEFGLVCQEVGKMGKMGGASAGFWGDQSKT